jgi:hypothetical protein
MAPGKKRSAKPYAWSIPATTESVAASDYLMARDLLPVRRVVPFGMPKPSAWKRRYLIEGFDFRDSLVDQILAVWKEDYTDPRDDGVLALLLGMQANSRYKSRTLANEIRKRHPQPEENSFNARYYEAGLRDAAQMLTR